MRRWNFVDKSAFALDLTMASDGFEVALQFCDGPMRRRSPRACLLGPRRAPPSPPLSRTHATCPVSLEEIFELREFNLYFTLWSRSPRKYVKDQLSAVNDF
jgi:hypothetical protein